MVGRPRGGLGRRANADARGLPHRRRGRRDGPHAFLREHRDRLRRESPRGLPPGSLVDDPRPPDGVGGPPTARVVDDVRRLRPERDDRHHVLRGLRLRVRRIRPRVLFRVKSVALVTTISVPVTIAYDLWTALGEWYFITRPSGVGIVTILEAQVPFTLYHLLSSLIFVPLFGSIFLFLHTYGWPARAPAAPSKTPD